MPTIRAKAAFGPSELDNRELTWISARRKLPCEAAMPRSEYPCRVNSAVLHVAGIPFDAILPGSAALARIQ